MRTIRNSDDPKMDAVLDAISILNSMGYKTLEVGWLILSGSLMIHVDASNNDYEIGDVQLDGVTLATYKL